MNTVETYQKSKLFMHLIAFEDGDAGTKVYLQLKSFAGTESRTTFGSALIGLQLVSIAGTETGKTFASTLGDFCSVLVLLMFCCTFDSTLDCFLLVNVIGNPTTT